MRAPRFPIDHPDRFLECQEALELEFLALVDAAQATGWSRAELLAALTDLADSTALGDGAREAMERWLRR